MDIKQSADSTLILATEGMGLLFYKDNKVILQVTDKDSLSTNFCKRIRVFGNRIYVCSNYGLTRFIYENNLPVGFLVFNLSNGLPSNIVNDVLEIGNEVFVGTSHGLIRLNSDEQIKPDQAPLIYIRSVNNNSRNMNWNNLFNLDYNNSNLSVNFQAISYGNPRGVNYEYSFGNNFTNWKSTNATELNFPNISPGKYKFYIRAKKLNSLWSETASFQFMVSPPFYQTYWFIALVTACFFGVLSIIAIYSYRRKMLIQVHHLEKRNVLNLERNRIASDMHDDLGSDLTKINMMTELIKIQTQANDEDQKTIGKISDIVSQSISKLDDIIWALNPSNDSLANLSGFVTNYCLNFFDGSSTKVDVKFDLQNQDIILNARQRRNMYLVIKEISNNSLKYAKASTFFLHLSSDEKNITIRIGDNGIGINENAKREFSNGLKNIEKRIRELNGMVNMTSESGSGTVYQIVIPINTNI